MPRIPSTSVGTVSGQPSSSWKPLYVSGMFGHLSAMSSTRSLSLSMSGQPSASWKPSLSSARSGHLSLSSGMLSPSRSPAATTTFAGAGAVLAGVQLEAEADLDLGIDRVLVAGHDRHARVDAEHEALARVEAHAAAEVALAEKVVGVALGRRRQRDRRAAARDQERHQPVVRHQLEAEVHARLDPVDVGVERRWCGSARTPSSSSGTSHGKNGRAARTPSSIEFDSIRWCGASSM